MKFNLMWRLKCFFNLDTCFKSSWWTGCNILKSIFASSRKIGFMSSLLLYKSMNHLVSVLVIRQCNGSSKAWLTIAKRFYLYFSWRILQGACLKNLLLSPSYSHILSKGMRLHTRIAYPWYPHKGMHWDSLSHPWKYWKLLQWPTRDNH